MPEQQPKAWSASEMLEIQVRRPCSKREPVENNGARDLLYCRECRTVWHKLEPPFHRSVVEWIPAHEVLEKAHIEGIKEVKK